MRFFLWVMLSACAAPTPSSPSGACPDVASTPPVASAPDERASLLASARRVECSGYPARVAVTLHSSTQATALVGSGSDNYASADYGNCRVTRSDVHCQGKWNASQTPADLRIMIEPNGTFMAEVMGQNGKIVVMSCLVTD